MHADSRKLHKISQFNISRSISRFPPENLKNYPPLNINHMLPLPSILSAPSIFVFSSQDIPIFTRRICIRRAQLLSMPLLRTPFTSRPTSIVNCDQQGQFPIEGLRKVEVLPFSKESKKKKEERKWNTCILNNVFIRLGCILIFFFFSKYIKNSINYSDNRYTYFKYFNGISILNIAPNRL